MIILTPAVSPAVTVTVTIHYGGSELK